MNKLSSIADACWDEICKLSSTTTSPTSNMTMNSTSYTGSIGDQGYTGYVMDKGVLKIKDGVFISPSLMKKCYEENKDKICDCCKQRGMKSCCSYVGNETLNFCGNSCDLDDGSYLGTYSTKLQTISSDDELYEIPKVWNLKFYMKVRKILRDKLAEKIRDPIKVDCVLNKLVEMYPNPNDVDFKKLTTDSNFIDTIDMCLKNEMKTNIPKILLVNDGNYPNTWNPDFSLYYKNFLNQLYNLSYGRELTYEKKVLIMDKLTKEYPNPALMSKNLIDIENNLVDILTPSIYKFKWLIIFLIIVLVCLIIGGFNYYYYSRLF